MKLCRFVVLIAFGLLPFVGCSTPAQDRSKLKEELKQEILAELRRQGEIPEQHSYQKTPEQVRQQNKAETQRDVSAKSESQAQTTANISTRTDAPQPSPTGRAEGYILRGGTGLKGCEVKLVRILTSRSAVEMFSAVRDGTEFTTITDEQGNYVFDRLPVGSYKLKWRLPGDKGWIRRLRDKPDAVITDGQTAILKSVETERRLVGR